jgi:hypothetical protein
MNAGTTPDFFDRLELELRRAAGRPPRRSPSAVAVAVAAVATMAALAIALVPLLAVLGGDDTGQPPATAQSRVGSIVERGGERHRIVAAGRAPVAGGWQLETYRSVRLSDPEGGEVYQPAGLRCLGIFYGRAGSGQCGEFPRTPGFSRLQHHVTPKGAGVRETLVFGRAPEQATAVVVTLRGRPARRVRPIEGPPGARGDFYLVALAPGATGRVNWLDRRGREGSRGIELRP